ncbi:MAG: 50S ribosomal protein L11 methyltransferase [Pseudomonadota bacterium]|nr:50S ribosomal protein L11 methyltransferase [Pseudomonadota bacterium]
MIFDDTRNVAYTRALKRVVTPDSVVMDLGAGLGIHGLVAAKLGARRVYLVEPANIGVLSERIARANGLEGRVTCVSGRVQELELPEKVDVIVSVFTGNFLLTEDLLPSLFLARDRFLAPGGTLLPDRARMEVVPVSAPGYHAKHIAGWAERSQGIDFTPVRELAGNDLYYDDSDAREVKFLSRPGKLLELDFNTAKQAGCRSRVRVRLKAGGTCHGWLGWFRMRLSGRWLSTSPDAEPTHWRQVFLPLDPPMELKEGAMMTFELVRPEFGDWTWTVETGGARQRHSTFLSEPLTPAVVASKADGFRGRLSERGRAAKMVLASLNGKRTSSEIAERLSGECPGLFSDQGEARHFVQSLIDGFV